MQTRFQSCVGSHRPRRDPGYQGSAGALLECGRLALRRRTREGLPCPGIKALRRKAPLNEWRSTWLETDPPHGKLKRRLFCEPPPSGPPSSLTLAPSPAHLPGLGEKAPCCNPSACCASFLFYLCPGPGSGTGVSPARNVGFHIKYSQDGHPRNVTYIKTAFSSNGGRSFLFLSKRFPRTFQY